MARPGPATRLGSGSILLLLLASSLPSLVCATPAPAGYIYCWNSLVPQPAQDNWAIGVMLPFIFVLLAVLGNAAANMKSSEWRLCCSKEHRPLLGRGLPVSAERDAILRSWLWISGVPLLPMLGLAITPWILLMYTPLDRCSIGHAARLWINTDTVVALAAIHLCIVPVVLIANVLVQQHYPQRRFCGRKGGGEASGRISVRLVGTVINKAVAFLVVVWCVNTWSAQGPMELTIYMVMYPIYVLFLRHAARITFRCHELEWSPNWLQWAAAVLLQPAVYLRANNAFLWFLIVLLTCLNFLDSLRGNTSERATAVLALQILACSALSIDIPQLKATMASIVFPEEQEPYVDLDAWTEDLNAMRLAHHNEIQAHNAVKPGAGAGKRRASVAVKYVATAPAVVTRPAENEVTAITITTANPTSGTVSRGSIVTVTQTPGGASTAHAQPRGSISPNAAGSARGSISPGPSSPAAAAAAAPRGSISPTPNAAKTRTSIIIANAMDSGPGSPSQPSGRKQAF